MQDRNGKSLTRDDEVIIKGKVLGFSGEGSRHVIVQTEDQTRVTVNVNQVEKVQKEKAAEKGGPKVAANDDAAEKAATDEDKDATA